MDGRLYPAAACFLFSDVDDNASTPFCINSSMSMYAADSLSHCRLGVLHHSLDAPVAVMEFVQPLRLVFSDRSVRIRYTYVFSLGWLVILRLAEIKWIISRLESEIQSVSANDSCVVFTT
jgi:hypothetical protein